MIRRRDLLGAGGFAFLATATSAGAIAFRGAQRTVPLGADRVLTQPPEQIDQWRLQASRDDMVDPIEIDMAFGAALQMYDRVVERDYVSSTSPRMMLNIAYKREIRQEERFHWPEFCYSTQGFQVSRMAPFQLGAIAPGVPVSRFVAERAGRRELVGYLLRVGDSMATGSMAVRSALFRQSLSLRVPDGVMLRISFLIDESRGENLNEASQILSMFFQKFIISSGREFRDMILI